MARRQRSPCCANGHPAAPGLITPDQVPIIITMTGSPESAQTYHELSAIARMAASLVDQIAPGHVDAYLATSAIVASVLSEFGVAASAVSGYFGTEPHSWLEADGFRIDIARALLDGPARPAACSAIGVYGGGEFPGMLATRRSCRSVRQRV